MKICQVSILGSAMGKAMLVLLAFFFIEGCATTSKSTDAITKVNSITITPPIIELEAFPSGDALQTPYEDRLMQDNLEKMAKVKLEKKFNVGLAPEIPRESMDSIKNEIGKLFLDLKEEKDIARAQTGAQIRNFLNEHFGNGDVLILYYRGYQRSKESLASGYQSAAYMAELGSKDGSMDGTNKNPLGSSSKNPMGTNLRPIYPNPPDEYGVTLTVLLLAGVEKEPVYFNTVYRAYSPKNPETMGRLINAALTPMEDLKRRIKRPLLYEE
jgi:hypothetical protein